jgi:Vitamin K-dependent gamma-carboxylase
VTGWNRYWFSPSPYLDLAVLRIVAAATQLFVLYGYGDYLEHALGRAALPDEYWEPLIILKIMNAPFSWGFRPPPDAVSVMYYVAFGAGFLALLGVLTNLSLLLFATASVYVHAFDYSFNDFHHDKAVMMIALGALTLSPCGRALSVDALVRQWRQRDGDSAGLGTKSEFAGWPIRLLQWFFVLMYVSAVWNKLSFSGLDWANGYTLQYIFARDGLRWGNPLGVWFSQFHWMLLLGQYTILLFQATFALAVIFPKLRWVYVPLGLTFHASNWIFMYAAFPQWMALYVIFIPWSALLQRLGEKRRHIEPAAARGSAKADAPG